DTSINLTEHVQDEEDGNNVTWSTDGAQNLILTILDNGLLNITADKDWHGARNITLTATDNEGKSNSTNITVTVDPQNDAPVLQNITNSTITQNNKLTIQLVGSDIDNEEFTYSITQGQIGNMKINATSGLFEWIPDHNYYGLYEVTFAVTDGNNTQDTKTADVFVYSTLNITNVVVNSQTVKPGDMITTTITVKNEGTVSIDNVMIELTSLSGIKTSDVGILSPGETQTDILSFQVPYDTTNGTYAVLIETEGFDHNDNDRRYSNFTYNIDVTQDMDDVVISNVTLENSIRCQALTPITINVSNIGTLNQNLVNVSITQAALGLSQYDDSKALAPSQTETYTFNINTDQKTAGTYNILVKAVYYDGNYVQKTVPLTIENCEPDNFLAIPSPITIAEDSYYDILDLNDYFKDNNNDTLTYGVVGNLTGLNFNTYQTTGLVNITLTKDYVGTNIINFTAIDSVNTTQSNPVTITITGENDAPVITAIGNKDFPQGMNFTEDVTVTDAENDLLVYSFVETAGLPLEINQSGHINNWTPTNDQVGNSYFINISVCDQEPKCAYEAFNITVSDRNDAPVLGNIVNKTTNEDELMQFTISATDVDANEVLSFTCDLAALNVNKINNNTANITWTPVNTDVGNHTVNCTVKDDSDAEDSQLFNIEVLSVDDAPVINPIADVTIPALEKYQFTITSADEENDALTYSITQGQTGDMSINNSGLFNWTPALSDIGARLIKINAAETKDLTKSDEDNFTINVIKPMDISNVKIKVNNGNFEDLTENGLHRVSPGDIVTLQIKIDNKFNNGKIYGVVINSTLQNVAGSDLTGMDGVNEIGIGQNITKDIVMGKISETAAGNYNLIIKTTAKNEQDLDIEDTFLATIKVQSDSHQIVVTSSAIDKPTVQCDRSIVVTATVKNVNFVSVNENVRVKVQNATLDIDKNTDYISIAKGDSATFTIPINITKDKPAGSYRLLLTAESDYTQDTDYVDITVQACGIAYTPTEEKIYLSNSASQTFNVNIPAGFNIKSRTWKILNETGSHTVATGTDTYTYDPEYKDGLKTRIVKLEIEAMDGYKETHQWTIKAADYPQTEIFSTTPVLSTLNATQLQNVTLTLNMPGKVKIEFLRPLDMTNIVFIDSFINATTGIAAFDSTSIFAVPVKITMYGLSYNEEPKIFTTDGFTTDPTLITENECMGLYCFIESRTPPPTTNGEVVFNTTVSSSFRVGTIAVPPVTNAPTARVTSSPSTIKPNTLVTLDGSGSTDNDGTIVSYLWTQTAGTSVTLSSTTTPQVTFTPTQTGTYTFQLTVTDNSGLTGQNSMTISVQETSLGTTGNLTISDLDIKVGSKTDKNLNNGEKISEEAKPGDIITFDIELKNTFDIDMNIENIEVDVTIRDIDDGDDIDDSGDIDQIKDGKDEKITIELEIPTKVDEDTYEVVIYAEGEDEDGNTHKVEWVLDLEVKKDRHAISIYNADLSPTDLRCSRSASLDIGIRNVGQKTEDVDLTITSSELGIDEGNSFELDENIDDNDNEYENMYTFRIDDDLAPGIYPIYIEAEYNSGDDSETKTLYLNVEDCIETSEPQADQEETNVDVKVIPGTTTPASSTATSGKTQVSFRDSSEYLVLLAIVMIILIGGLTYAIGAAIILSKR
ncbi:MAG: Ig-like domain-containing protein, partial [Nanoarchaeota archaeon]